MTITVTLTEDEVTWLEEGIQALCADKDHSASEKQELAALKDKLTTDRRDSIMRAIYHAGPGQHAFNQVAIANAYAKRQGYLVTDVIAGKNKAIEIGNVAGRIYSLKFGEHLIPVMLDATAPTDRLTLRFATDLFEYTMDKIGGSDEETP